METKNPTGEPPTIEQRITALEDTLSKQRKINEALLPWYASDLTEGTGIFDELANALRDALGLRKIKQRHVWRAGDDDAVCAKCGITNREATALGQLNGCTDNE
jgi:hypothetical protein